MQRLIPADLPECVLVEQLEAGVKSWVDLPMKIMVKL
jgi:hypothetical protein